MQGHQVLYQQKSKSSCAYIDHHIFIFFVIDFHHGWNGQHLLYFGEVKWKITRVSFEKNMISSVVAKKIE